MAKALKKKAARKLVSARVIRRRVFAGASTKKGTEAKTSSGLSKADLKQNKHGKIVSKTKSAMGKKNPWIAACGNARQALNITGFEACKKGSAFYNKATELYKKI